MHVVVLGAGSLGSLLGGLLAREHPVTLVGRADNVAAIRRDGLTVTGELSVETRPDARTDLPATADLVLVSVKSYDTAAAARDLAAMTDPGAVLSVQNGMGNEATLAGRLSAPVLAGTCSYGARLVDPGVVRCNGVGELALGPHTGELSVAERAGEAVRRAGIETVVREDMRRRLWSKLAVNAGVNATTALARVPNGALLDGPAADTAAAATREAVAAAGDAPAPGPDEAVERLQAVLRTTADNRSSMRQDIEAGQRTEVDAVNGYVVSQADAPTPVNRTLASLLTAWERNRGLR